MGTLLWRPGDAPRDADEVAKLTILGERLLTLGGDRVLLAAGDPDLDILLARGETAPGRARRVGGRPNGCHENAARYWRAHPDTCAIVTGYALSEDGMWRQHSWLRATAGRRGTLETTVRRARYHGVVLNPDECAEFARLNGPRPPARATGTPPATPPATIDVHTDGRTVMKQLSEQQVAAINDFAAFLVTQLGSGMIDTYQLAFLDGKVAAPGSTSDDEPGQWRETARFGVRVTTDDGRVTILDRPFDAADEDEAAELALAAARAEVRLAASVFPLGDADGPRLRVTDPGH